MTDPKKTLRYPEVMAEEGLDDWRFFLVKLHARFKTGSFVKGLELVTRITEAAEEANHHPDVVLTYPQVDVDLHQPRRAAASPAATSTWPGGSARSPPSSASRRRRARSPRSSLPSTYRTPTR